ncbi:3-oxoacyl-[acyl-carrier-protein] reductase [Parasporobacterium paucivorans]|uniref:3-oxoacyl-[acyl-carrier-protein] reductase n=1 Tax=Parasporobacterium paucivorans DSM 15970 TaxID=1122934 RepID=A0A1M6KBZ1_9FIRM|nr:3-oxoacyl-[acyl-carrier-protein] reductase [Parasporobacterium paucivorans]SHJ56473.1 3-oxoacyl-[acyl-carrier-protein] reductase [Parasporobacterium paucivorans DSM 15970]
MLKGKKAVITGASRGIGRAIALKFAEYGADVAIIYAGNEEAAQEVCKEAQAKGVDAKAFQCNVADFEEAKQTVAKIKEQFGTVDILVNNAGITRDGLIAMMKESDFDAVLDTNLKGAFNMIRHCTPIFMKNRKGKIVNMSSISGIMGNAGQANYSASKAGLIGLTKSVARELAARNVCCNAIAPGMIRTDMTADFSSDHPMIASIPMGRIGEVEDVAELAAFLAADISNYITGEVIRVDGGMAI